MGQGRPASIRFPSRHPDGDLFHAPARSRHPLRDYHYDLLGRQFVSGADAFTIEGQRINALGFEIVDAPNNRSGKKWPGGVRVWLSDDARRIPFRIEIQQSMASLQLELQSVESCAFMQTAAASAR